MTKYILFVFELQKFNSQFLNKKANISFTLRKRKATKEYRVYKNARGGHRRRDISKCAREEKNKCARDAIGYIVAESVNES